MNHKKKALIAGLAAAASLLSLSACSLFYRAPASVRVDSESYIVAENAPLAQGKTYLAVKLSVKNDTKKAFQLSASDFTLVNKNGSKLKDQEIISYTSKGSFHPLAETRLAAQKSVSGYVVFAVSKGQKYDLHYKPALDSSKQTQKPRDVVNKLDSAQATSDASSLKGFAKDYVNAVFLGQSGVKSKLDNNLTTAHTDFVQTFSKNLAQDLSGASSGAAPSDSDMKNIADAYLQTNQKKARVTYSVKEVFPSYAVIAVKPTVLNFDDIDMNGLAQDWIDKNVGNYDSVDQAENDLMKYIIQQMPSKVATLTPKTPDDMPSEGYELIMTKNAKGKWTVNNKTDSLENFEYLNLARAFMGGESSFSYSSSGGATSSA